MPAAATAPSRPLWLFGPGWDLLLGCGGLYLLVFAFSAFAGPQIRATQPESFFPLLVILFLSPHYGATILRVYEQRSERRRYWFFTCWVTLGLLALFLLGLQSVLVASLLVTIYLTWNPWHYAGQNYGLGVMYLGRAGAPPAPWLKKTLYASFVLATVLAFLVMHGTGFGANYGASNASDDIVRFISLGIPSSILAFAVPAVGLAYFGTIVVAGVALARTTPLRALLPLGGLVAMHGAWFVVPLTLQHFQFKTGIEPLDSDFRTHYFAWIAVTHSVQYLWVTTYTVRQSPSWPGFGTYWLKAIVAGQALVSIPLIVFGPQAFGTLSYEGGLYVLVLAVMNLHHFLLDGAIWKLRGRIGKVLVGAARDDATEQAGPGSPWPRRLIWSAAVLGLVAASFDHWTRWVQVPSALRDGNVAEASRRLDRVVWLGTDSEHRRAQFLRYFRETGDDDRALYELERVAALRPTVQMLVDVGVSHERRGNFEKALAAYQTGLELEPDRVGLLHRSGELLLKMDRPADARRVLRRAVELRADHQPSRQALRRANQALRKADEAASS